MSGRPLALAAYSGLGIWLTHASPDPPIDVMTVHREAITALREGRSPYGITFPNIYPDGRFHPDGMTANGRVLYGLPHPPASLLLAAPGHLLAGDIRYAELAALLATAVLMAMAGGGEVAKLAAMAFLFTPRTPSGFAAALGLVCLLLFLFSKKAFCNYYFFVIGAWCCAIASSPDEHERSSPDAAGPAPGPGGLRLGRRH